MFKSSANSAQSTSAQSTPHLLADKTPSPVAMTSLATEDKHGANSHILVVTLTAGSVCLLLMLLFFRSVKYKRQLALSATTDALTGLTNRRRILEEFDAELLRSKANGLAFSVALIDVDWFKQINEKYGLFTGNKVLRLFASTSKDILRHTDFIGRISDEQFLVLMPNTSNNEAFQVMENLRLKMPEIAEEIDLPNLVVSTSIGICHCVPNDNVESILQLANSALYRAKQNGRDQSVACDR
ncbi:GGDEF domain-containing protein [Paraglaciecola aquimarina]|uniref:diguanylate cyclase n=1 Tax=Paraglaciecola aquimarina TaxID=1235557 RepID=A0ABU3SRX0_9ALTE|nr:GGDEF domain-containing protein [Paraglaciecola aquimarina]MDU0352732.1 GGDEF domain-containing protein [Paraglaciecola aquimarina]